MAHDEVVELGVAVRETSLLQRHQEIVRFLCEPPEARRGLEGLLLGDADVRVLGIDAQLREPVVRRTGQEAAAKDVRRVTDGSRQSIGDFARARVSQELVSRVPVQSPGVVRLPKVERVLGRQRKPTPRLDARDHEIGRHQRHISRRPLRERAHHEVALGSLVHHREVVVREHHRVPRRDGYLAMLFFHSPTLADPSAAQQATPPKRGNQGTRTARAC